MIAAAACLFVLACWWVVSGRARRTVTAFLRDPQPRHAGSSPDSALSP